MGGNPHGELWRGEQNISFQSLLPVPSIQETCPLASLLCCCVVRVRIRYTDSFQTLGTGALQSQGASPWGHTQPCLQKAFCQQEPDSSLKWAGPSMLLYPSWMSLIPGTMVLVTVTSSECRTWAFYMLMLPSLMVGFSHFYLTPWDVLRSLI